MLQVTFQSRYLSPSQMNAGDSTHHRDLLRKLFYAGIEAADGERLLRQRGLLNQGGWEYEANGTKRLFPIAKNCNSKLVVVGAGKAAASLAAGLESSLGDHVHDGCIVVKYGHTKNLERIRIVEGGHPIPDEAGARGTNLILNMLGQLSSNDRAFVLLTGGASSLLSAPAPGITLAEKSDVHRRLVLSGATINEINTVRKHISSVKGGGLLRRCNGARVCTLVISDVIGNDLATIGSGPTVPDPSTFQDALEVLRSHALADLVPRSVVARLADGARGQLPETLKRLPSTYLNSAPIIVADIDSALDGVTRCARANGAVVNLQEKPMDGDTHAAARAFARWILGATRGRRAGGTPLVFAAGGETTLTVRGRGRGGRNQEFALMVAFELSGYPNVSVLVAGTDGTDGPTDVAGAFVDGTTLERATKHGQNPREILEKNDSYRLFDSTGDHFRTGPTGTNVMDMCIGVVS
jgi:hydroxypyruvate reductase